MWSIINAIASNPTGALLIAFPVLWFAQSFYRKWKDQQPDTTQPTTVNLQTVDPQQPQQQFFVAYRVEPETVRMQNFLQVAYHDCCTLDPAARDEVFALLDQLKEKLPQVETPKTEITPPMLEGQEVILTAEQAAKLNQ